MSQSYTVIQSDPGNKLFEGQTVTPYHEDAETIILAVPGSAVSHHIRKSGEYFATHFNPAGGQ